MILRNDIVLSVHTRSVGGNIFVPHLLDHLRRFYIFFQDTTVPSRAFFSFLMLTRFTIPIGLLVRNLLRRRLDLKSGIHADRSWLELITHIHYFERE
jgi:hypothetical protein